MLGHGVLFRSVHALAGPLVPLNCIVYVLQPPRKGTTSEGAEEEDIDDQDLDERCMKTSINHVL